MLFKIMLTCIYCSCLVRDVFKGELSLEKDGIETPIVYLINGNRGLICPNCESVDSLIEYREVRNKTDEKKVKIKFKNR